MSHHKDDEKEIGRNLTSDKGRNNDPHVRDESGQRPGMNTISSSDTDRVNESTTRSASDGYKTPFGKDADPTFEDGDKS
jgi:hypothetical protein